MDFDEIRYGYYAIGYIPFLLLNAFGITNWRTRGRVK
jgi:hypothetical protein